MDASEKLAILDKQLDVRSASLIALVEKEHINIDLRLPQSIAAQSEAWRVFRSAECYVSGAIIGGGGAWPEAHAADCEVRLTSARIQIFDTVVACINAFAPEQRQYDSFECLRKLRSLPDVE